MRTKDKLIHVEFKEPKKGKKHHYFGSIAAIFTQFTNKETGICLQYIYRYKLTEDNPLENKKCIIRVGSVVRIPTNRTAPIRVIRVV